MKGDEVLGETGDSLEFVALDLETTGLSSAADRIIELGAIRFDSTGRELDCFQSLINPGRPVSPGAFQVHGLGDQDLKDAPPAAIVLPQFLSWLDTGGGSPACLAHNARFDALFLGTEIGRAGIVLPDLSLVDTLELSRRLLPRSPNHRLDTLAAFLQLDESQAHRAIADCRRVKGLWIKLEGWHSENHTRYCLADSRREPPRPPVGWERLSEAMACKWPVRICYQGGTKGLSPREVRPRRFDYHGGTAYLVAFCVLSGFEKSFRLDRIVDYEVVMPVALNSPV